MFFSDQESKMLKGNIKKIEIKKNDWFLLKKKKKDWEHRFVLKGSKDLPQLYSKFQCLQHYLWHYLSVKYWQIHPVGWWCVFYLQNNIHIILIIIILYSVRFETSSLDHALIRRLFTDLRNEVRCWVVFPYTSIQVNFLNPELLSPTGR